MSQELPVERKNWRVSALESEVEDIRVVGAEMYMLSWEGPMRATQEQWTRALKP